MNTFRSVFLCFALSFPVVAVAAPVDGNIVWEGASSLSVAWNATPGKTYQLLSATDPAGPWQPVLPGPSTYTAVTNWLAQSFAPDQPRRFFRVVQVDTEGPEVYRTEPADGGIAVSPQAGVRVWLRDETGINTNSISLSITNGPAIAWGDSRLSFSDGVLTYTPGTGEILGDPGDTVTVSLSATDTLGNQTANFTWSFQLELPVVLNNQILFVGGAGGQTSIKAFGRVAAQTASGLTLISTNGDTFTYTYTGVSSGLTNGQHLVNADLNHGYTRTVVSFTEYAASNTVVVVTRPTKLAELLQEGSLSAHGFTELAPQGATQAAAALSAGLPLNYHHDLAQVVYQSGGLTVELLPGSAFDWNGKLDLGVNIRDFRLREFESILSGTVTADLKARVSLSDGVSSSGSKGLIKPIQRIYGTFIGLVPVWIEVVYEINVGYSASAEVADSLTASISGSKGILVGRRWSDAEGWTTPFDSPAASFNFTTPAFQAEVTASASIWLEPKVTVYLYSAAGVTGNLQPYLKLSGRAQVNPPGFELGLYAGLTSTIGLDLRVWDDAWGEQPSTTFDLIPSVCLWSTNSFTNAPQITMQPQSLSVKTTDTATFTVEAKGRPPLRYRWFKNGLLLGDGDFVTGTRTTTLNIPKAKPYDAGNYAVEVKNDWGVTNSEVARLDVHFAPTNMVLIPVGSFTMGDSLTEGDSFTFPIHAVYLSAFYMDRTEVTKALWDEVYQWAVGRGYGFDNVGAGKGAKHPVQTVSWYDGVKWCNARSEKEGRKPAYYTDATQRTVYRNGQLDVQNDWVNWSSGYRLPTEAEWEKAALGGLNGKRFPWGNTISESQANYNSDPARAPFDLGPKGYNPTYSVGGFPFTSPAASFAANGYGLYDMAGNVWEWCWDWYGDSYYRSSPGSDPRGPSSGSERVLRGGCWYSPAMFCRLMLRTSMPLQTTSYGLGFRTVLPFGLP